MAIVYSVTGKEASVKGLYIEVNAGQVTERLILNAVEGCAGELPSYLFATLNHIFLSSMHLSHMAGLYGLLERTLGCGSGALHLWVPAGSAALVESMLWGVRWPRRSGNLRSVIVNEVHGETVLHFTLHATNGYTTRYDLGTLPIKDRAIWISEACTVSAILVEHDLGAVAPVAVYRVDEPPKQRIDKQRLGRLGLKGGAWLQAVQDPGRHGEVDVGGELRDLDALRRELLRDEPGESLALLSHVMVNKAAYKGLAPFLEGCDRLICHVPYCNSDLELARKEGHPTAKQIARLAHMARAQKLFMYGTNTMDPGYLEALLKEASEGFEHTRLLQ